MPRHRESHGREHEAAEKKKRQQHWAEDDAERFATQQQDRDEQAGGRSEGEVENSDRLGEETGIADGLRYAASEQCGEDLAHPMKDHGEAHEKQHCGCGSFWECAGRSDGRSPEWAA